MSTFQKIGFFLGPIIGVIMAIVTPPEGLPVLGMRALGVTAWMGIWWLTEAVPIWVTSLLPIVGSFLFGIAGTKVTKLGIDVYKNYGHPIVMLVIGIFILAAVIEKWNLHKRIALNIVCAMGTKPSSIILGFSVATGVISMFMSNTTATAMMLPIGLSIVAQMNMAKTSPFAKAMTLCIAYGASIGGMSTIIGTTTNIAGVGLIKQMSGVDITFLEFLKVGIPFAVILLPLATMLVCWLYKVNRSTSLGDISIVRDELNALGPMQGGEKITAYVSFVVMLAFIFREQLNTFIPLISDEGLATLVGVLMFVIPVNFKKGIFLIDSKTAIREISWSTVLLIGGSLSLGEIFAKTGVAKWMSAHLTFLSGYSELMIIIILAVGVGILTEFCTNVVVASAFIPPIYALAVAIGANPMVLMMTITLSASFAYMLPSGTPPNAVAFASGAIDMKDMAKTGLWVKILSIIVFPPVMYFISMRISSLFG